MEFGISHSVHVAWHGNKTSKYRKKEGEGKGRENEKQRVGHVQKH